MGQEGDRRVSDSATEIRTRLVTPTFLVITVATFAYFVAVGALLPVLPRYVEGPLGKGSVAVGLSVGSFSLVALVLRPLAGRLGDRRGRRLLIVLGSTVVACAVAALTLAESLSVLILLRLCTGAGEAFFFTGVASAIHDLAPDDRRGEAVSYFSLALYAGLAVGPILGEGILGERNFAAVWWVAAGLCGLAAVLALRLPDTRSTGSAGSGRTKLIHPAAVVPGVVVTTSVWGFSGFASFVSLYAIQLGMNGARLVFLVYSVVILAIRSVGARIPDRLGAAVTTRAALLCNIGGLLLMAGWATPGGLFFGTALFAVGQALLFPGLMTLAVRGAPSSERGAVVGTFTAFFDLSFGLGAVSLGAVAAAFGYRGVFVTGALVAAGGLALFTLTIGRDRRSAVRAAEQNPGQPSPRLEPE